MKEKTTGVIELTYLQLVVIFLILVLLKELDIISLPINYVLFACVLPLFAIPTLLRLRPSEAKNLKAMLTILLVVFFFILLSRFLPQTRSFVPLGYDPGFYKYAIDIYTGALPQIPEEGLASWIKEMYPQGLFVLSDTIYIISDTHSFEIIKYLLPLLGAILVFPVFIVTRSLFGQRAGVIASVLYAISYTQYATFTMLYFKNVLGLMFLLLSIYALEKKKYSLMAIMFAALGIFHRPEFLLFALILIPYFLMHRRKGIIYAVLGMVILIAPFWIPRWEANWDLLWSTAIGTMMTNIQTGAQLGSGTFFDLNTYIVVSMAYLPFSIIGAIYLVIKRNWNTMLFYFIINSIIVVFRLVFFNRFIIPLDIAMVILAAAAIDYTLLNKRGVWKLVGAAVGLLLLVVVSLPMLTMMNNVKPLISEEQLKAIEWIRDNTEEDAYVLTTNYDAPWVLGWSERKVIAPGLFEWNVYNKDEWFKFFETKDPEVAKQFLDVYNGHIYIYYSKNRDNYLGLDKFQANYFWKVYDNSAVIYKYYKDD